MKLKKVAYKKEPILHVHRYVVMYFKPKSKITKYAYCQSMKEVREMSSKLPKGTVVEVFRATHNFIQAFERV